MDPAATRIDDSQRELRARLVDALGGANAHMPFADVIRDVPAEARDRKTAGAPHSLWEVLEHLRITLWDILEFSRNPRHESPEFPAGYWPAAASTSAGGAWERSIAAFETDLAAFRDLVADPRRDLYAKLEHPQAKPHHTLLREAMVVVDHNGYHLGELVLLRRLLGVWPSAG